MVAIGSVLAGLYQDQPDFIDGTSPAQAPDGAIVPEYTIRGEIAGNPSSFVAHGVGYDTIVNNSGSDFAQGEGIISPNLNGLGASIVNPARARDGYGLQGPGTPEPAINAPRQGAILDSHGIVHLGIGPGIPLALLAIIAGFLYLTRKGAAA